MTEAEVLQAILAQDIAIFDRIQQLITAVSGGGVCAALCDYGYFYNLEASATVAVGAPFPFDSDGPVSAGFSHQASPIPGTSAPITILNAGIYKVDFTVTVAEARQIALYLNGVVVPSTIYGQATGTSVTTGVALIEASAGDELTLRNHLSAAALTLVTPSGGSEDNVTNSLTILKIA